MSASEKKISIAVVIALLFAAAGLLTHTLRWPRQGGTDPRQAGASAQRAAAEKAAAQRVEAALVKAAFDTVVFSPAHMTRQAGLMPLVSRHYVTDRSFAQVCRFYMDCLAPSLLSRKNSQMRGHLAALSRADSPGSIDFVDSSHGQQVQVLMEKRAHISTASFVKRVPAGSLSVYITRAAQEKQTSISLVFSRANDPKPERLVLR